MRKSLLGILPALFLAAVPTISSAGVSVGISVNFGPPPLPVYVQPRCPGAGYIWTPGYWAWDGDDYYWVPGTWVIAPAVGLLWTPGYWGWSEGLYVWHAGYWGPHVGFYGGINYGFGYTGMGFAGGYWHGHDFYYNRSVTNVNVTNVTNVYNKTVINNVTVNHVSYNGGTGGIAARPTPVELTAEHERHVSFTPVQREHEHLAASNHDLRASVNNGKPTIAATAKPAMFTGRGVVAARAPGGPVHLPNMKPEHGGPAQQPQMVHGAGVSGGHTGGPGGAAGANAMRSDRPPQAQGQHPQMAHAAGGTSGGAGPMRADRPPQAQGQHPQMARAAGGTSGGAGPMRADRPPQAQGQHPQMAHAAGEASGHAGPMSGRVSGGAGGMRSDRPPQEQVQHPQMVHSAGAVGGHPGGMPSRPAEMRPQQAQRQAMPQQAQRQAMPPPQHFAERPSAPMPQQRSAPVQRSAPGPAPHVENRGGGGGRQEPGRQEPGRH